MRRLLFTLVLVFGLSGSAAAEPLVCPDDVLQQDNVCGETEENYTPGPAALPGESYERLYSDPNAWDAWKDWACYRQTLVA